MRGKWLLGGLAAAALLLGAGAMAGNELIKVFWNGEGEAIYVHTDEEPESYEDSELPSGGTMTFPDEEVKIGDVIEMDGWKERVIAIGENGEFITELITEADTETDMKP